MIEYVSLGHRKLKRHDNYIEEYVILNWMLDSPNVSHPHKRNSSDGEI